MDDQELRPVARIDAPHLVAAIEHADGPSIELVGPLAGGAVGAWLVRRPDGALSVLTWSPPAPPGVHTGAFDTARSLMEIACAAGVPVPRYEDVVALADGSVAVLQAYAAGVPVTTASAALVDRVVDLAELRRGILTGHPLSAGPCPLYLTSSGPGFCHHEPLRRHSAATRTLLTRIQDVGAELGDHLEQQITGGADGPTFRQAWAHTSLRLVDWTIRHQPEMVDHWVSLAGRHL